MANFNGGHKTVGLTDRGARPPSVLHAHEYDRNLKLDAITGDIFDATTRDHCMRLKNGKLRDIQAQLRDSPGFSATVAQHIDDPN